MTKDKLLQMINKSLCEKDRINENYSMVMRDLKELKTTKQKM